jgi:6,7-dimethyl-8-ribityllumazine synthase
MTDQERSGTYNPFEDTGDWPFRDSTSAAPPRLPEERPEEREPVGPSLFDREASEPAKEFVPVIPPAEPEEEPEAEPDPQAAAEPEPEPEAEAAPAEPEVEPAPEAEPEPELEAAPVEIEEDLPEPEAFPEEPAEPHEPLTPPEAVEAPDQHAPGELRIPDGPEVLEGGPNGFRRTVAVVVSRFNADVTNRLLESAVDALVDAHVNREAITIVPVPGAFELPLAAMALAKTRRFSCIVALGCVIRGETPHFDFVAGEAASGLQLAAIETGVPVSFGLLTVETQAQADARVGKGAEAARAALEMADLFTQVRTRASRQG